MTTLKSMPKESRPFYDSDAPETVRLTRGLVEEFSVLPACPGDRPLSKIRLAAHRSSVEAGEFRHAEWSQAYCAETDTIYRVNGQHTVTLFKKMYEEGLAGLLRGIYIHFSTYYCDTLEDLARLYSTYDNHGVVRTQQNIVQTHAAMDPELAKLPTINRNAAVAGYSFALFGSCPHRKTKSHERARLMYDHKDFMIWFHEILSGGDDATTHERRVMRRSPVAGLMFKTFRKHPRKATEFWTEVRDGSSPRGSGSRTLHDHLNRTSVNHGQGAAAFRDKESIAAQHEKAARAWNAWRSGKDIKILKALGLEDDVKIL